MSDANTTLLNPAGTVVCAPSSGAVPLAVTATVTLTQGATKDIRFYGQRPDGTYARWGGGNAHSAKGTLKVAGRWSVFARLWGANDVCVDTPCVVVNVIGSDSPLVTPTTPTPTPSRRSWTERVVRFAARLIRR